MAFNLRRTFFNVGFGLFAVEDVDGCVSVYDCGSAHKNIIKDAVMRFHNKWNEIDNLFISHFDKDHVNGIWCLLSMIKVKRIFLPMVYPLQRIVSFAKYRSDGHYQEFIIDPEEFIRRRIPEAEIVRIGLEDDMQDYHPYDPNTVNIEDVKNNDQYPNQITLYHDNWLYLLYNKRVLSLQEYNTFMNRLGLKAEATFDEICDALSQKNVNLKKSLNHIFSSVEIKRINDYSMVLWSGDSRSRNTGCLYSGDYNARNYLPELKKAFTSVWTQNDGPDGGIIQLPHHGSEISFNTAICNKNAIHVISSSNHPIPRRPNPQPVIGILNRMGYMHLETFKNDIII